jgi:chitodextrinase
LAAVGDPKVWGYFISDEPNPYACPNAPSQHQARSALIHSVDPTKPTVIVLDSNGFSGLFTQDALDQMPLWKGTADYIGLDPYPCRQGSPCQFSWIDKTIQAANAAGLNYWGVLQIFNDSSWRWPTADELSRMINQWAGSKETGSMAYAWTWAGYNLSDHPDLLSLLQSFNTTGSTGSADTSPPSAPAGLSKTAATASSVSLAWTASTDNVGVTGYNVYNGSSLVGSTTSTGYMVGSLACSTSYTFAVEAKDAAGNLSTRTTLTASTGACPSDTTPPSAPGTPTVTATAATSLALMWSPSIDNVGVTGYDVFLNSGKVGTVGGATTSYIYGGLACGTAYTLGVVAYDSAGNRSPMSTVGGSTSACTTTSDPVVVAAGDICGSPTSCTPTANLIGSINPTAVLTLGDNAYDTGSASDYASYYDPNWGKYKSITDPAPGNHEYDYGNQQTGYFAYFNNPAAYYSYDIGSWHLISLNGEISSSAGSAQDLWLQNDLAAHKNMCTLAYWHEPRWSSGYHGNSSYYGRFWTDLYTGGADLVLNGHDHDYERFAPQDPSGNLDTARGMREFVSGTGGESHYTFNAPVANSEVRDSTSFGVLKLTLHAASYDWKFVPVAGATFTDSGSSNCH